ncbi:MAG: serine/threonine-protein kinase, partial [Acidobacteria bacterium]
REAQVLASLNHPNIAAIYGIEESHVQSPASSVRALVMELVEGDDLSAHIARGAMPVADALAIAKQIADALEAAHEQSIVHRDLKPQNIKVRADGTVKVLDFGLAKAMDPAGTSSADAMNSPTMTARATQMGMIIGTAAYMSPEQARGKAVDRRADIWAFGAVLYEMLSGRRAFDGEDISVTLANVIKEDPKWGALPATLPTAIARLLRRCLEKDPKKRLSWIGEARLIVESPDLAEAAPGPSAAASRRGALKWLGATIAAAAITGAIVWQARAPQPPPEERLSILLPTVAPPQAAVISPDASMVAILADDKVWLRRLNEFSAVEVAGSEGARAIFWSPDSAHIGFEARGQLWRVGARGGAPTVIGKVPTDFTPAGGASWSANGKIVFSTGTSSLMEIAAEGLTPARELLSLDPKTDVDVHEPSLLPDGESVLFVMHPTPGNPYGVHLFSGGQRRMVFSPGNRPSNPVYSPTGHLVFDMNGGVWAVPFSLKTMSTTGDPVLVADAARHPSAAADGSLVMLSGSASTSLSLTQVDANGKPGSVVWNRRVVNPRVSPDGRLVAASSGFGADADIWVFDLARNTERRLTFESSADNVPSWSPDGRFIVYQCDASICARPADGGGSRVELLAGAADPVMSPDGRRLLVRRPDGADQGLYHIDLGPAGLTGPITATPALVVSPRAMKTFDVSPDGRFVAYASRDNGVDAVFVTRLPKADGKWELPVRLATEPRWSANGDRLFVTDELARLVEVPVDLRTTFSAGAPVIRMHSLGMVRGNGYDRFKDGQSFVVPLPPAAIDTQTRVLIIRNWSPK